MLISYEAIAMIAMFAVGIAVMSLIVSLILVGKVYSRPKMHYDEEDRCWILDDCVRISDEAACNVGDYRKYFNYSKRCENSVHKSPYPVFFFPKWGMKREERRAMAMQGKKGE